MAHSFSRDHAPALNDRAQIFLARFLKSPLSVASPFASSERLVRRLLAPLDWHRFKLVVEYGAGTGSFTRYALQRMPADARLIALDTDPAFTRALVENVPDPRLIALTESAENVCDLLAASGIDRADCIISGLPFSSVGKESADRILGQSERVLAGNGIFAAYQVRSTLLPLLQARFAAVRKSYEWRNIPPCHLYWARNAPFVALR